jgi:hypothetical protein
MEFMMSMCLFLLQACCLAGRAIVGASALVDKPTGLTGGLNGADVVWENPRGAVGVLEGFPATITGDDVGGMM